MDILTALQLTMFHLCLVAYLHVYFFDMENVSYNKENDNCVQKDSPPSCPQGKSYLYGNIERLVCPNMSRVTLSYV